MNVQYIKKSREEINVDYMRLPDEHLHVHPYDPEVMEQIRDDMFEPRTCAEWSDWLETHPHYDMSSEASSQWLRGTHRDEAFDICARINTDWDSISEHVAEYARENRINEEFETKHDDEWRINKTEKQTTHIPFRYHSELDNQRKHGFTKQYQLIEVTLQECFPELQAMSDLFEIEYAKADINYQPTSGQFPRHVDFLSTALKKAVNDSEEIANTQYNPITKSPEGWRLCRILIALDNWYPGQQFGFEEHNWTNWQRGETLRFNWANCRHATANTSYNPRPLLKVTGLIRDDHWLARGEYREFTL